MKLPIVFALALAILSIPHQGAAQTADNLNCTDCVQRKEIVDGAINNRKLAPGTVGTSRMQNGAVTSRKLAGGSVTESKLSQALLDRLNELEAQIALSSTVLVKANGTPIGAFLDASAEFGTQLFRGGSFWALSDTDYVFQVRADTSMAIGPAEGALLQHVIGMGGELGYAGLNCTGQAYVLLFETEGESALRQGYVFAAPDSADPVSVYYSPAGSAAVGGIMTQSSRSGGMMGDTCQNVPGGGAPGMTHVAVLPNVPAVTGVANVQMFPTPITLGR